MLGRMFGTGDDGLRDRLTDFSRPVSGAYYYAPPLNVLADLPISAADDQRVAVPG
jgi:porphyrinogen peroxidase